MRSNPAITSKIQENCNDSNTIAVRQSVQFLGFTRLCSTCTFHSAALSTLPQMGGSALTTQDTCPRRKMPLLNSCDTCQSLCDRASGQVSRFLKAARQ